MEEGKTDGAELRSLIRGVIDEFVHAEQLKMKSRAFFSCANCYKLTLSTERFDTLRLGIGTRATSEIDGLSAEVTPELKLMKVF